jgi:hypothetical protein
VCEFNFGVSAVSSETFAGDISALSLASLARLAVGSQRAMVDIVRVAVKMATQSSASYGQGSLPHGQVLEVERRR